jgi:choline dehydrogenase
MSVNDRYDYIIVGGGSSACVVAEKLVRDGKARVLLLERGPAKANPIMSFPAGYMKFLAKDTYLAMHQTKPQPQLNGRGVIVPQGKVLVAAARSTPWFTCAGRQQTSTSGTRLVTPTDPMTMPGLTKTCFRISKPRRTTTILRANSTVSAGL